ncbi:universal stress protein [Muricauda sp. JGD-17]|uniref:Universal stress protein n=1 Tax=Flagellimonas ochracea TaxID=2696472 RepID=A0A964WWM7_9FLAO|nr:universal stress protein [Allomuricauda ochracea]NAY90938.1 universal stress protein [Allomuricauda ochracea]
MSPKTTKNKYRISVLLDLTKASETILTNAVQLAKAIDGSVAVFHVKPALSLVDRESQLSAIRNIRDQEKNTLNTLQQLVNTVGEQENITIPFTMASGNVKNRIQTYIAEEKPDILVLGKPRSRTNLLGASITDFVVDKINTHVLIMVEDHKLDTFKGLSLGIFGNTLPKNGQDIISDLKQDNDKPIRVFQIKSQQSSHTESETAAQHKTIDYVFTEGANALDSLVKYVHRTNTELLCIPKGNKKTFAFKSNPSKEVLRKSDVPILIMGS